MSNISNLVMSPDKNALKKDIENAALYSASKKRLDIPLPINHLTDEPTKAWNEIKATQTVKPLNLIDPTTPVDPNKIRFVCLSDTHSKVEKEASFVPPGNVLLHAGDFTSSGDLESIHIFDTFLGHLEHKVKIVIAGNHELALDTDLQKSRRNKALSIFGLHTSSFELKKKQLKCSRDILQHCIYLQDTYVEVCGIKIYGSPWQPEYCGWAFNLSRGEALAKKWDLIPDDTDILITHTPPLGYGDLCVSHMRAGCAELLTTVQMRVKPKYHLFGHIHEGYGVTTDDQTIFINGSNVTKNYMLENKPIVFDYPVPDGHSKFELCNLPVNNIV